MFTMPKDFIATSRKVAVPVDCEKLSDAILLELVLHGLQQKIADAASGAKAVADETQTDVAEVTRGMMEKARDALYAGNWTRKGTGESVDTRTTIARQIVRNLFKAKVGSKSPQWAKFTGLEPFAQLAKLDEWYAKDAEKYDVAVNAEIARRAAAESEKAAIVVEFDI